MFKSNEPSQPSEQNTQGNRPKIGVVDGEPKAINQALDQLPPLQNKLREVVIKEFKYRKVTKFVEKQIEHINGSRQLSEGIRFLFDEHGKLPANAPLEDIVEERKKTEHLLRLIEAVATELRNLLGKLTEIENDALDLLHHNQDKE